MDNTRFSEICYEYNKRFDTNCDLSNSRLEDYLGKSAPYRHITTSLTSKNISLRKNLIYTYRSTDSEERKFELATLRIIAGAVVVFCDPLAFGSRGSKAGLSNEMTPDLATQNASKNLLKHINNQNLGVGRLFKHHLERMAQGMAPMTIPNFSENKEAKIKMLVREVALLSKGLLIISNNKACRFPTQALLRIFDIVEVSVSEKTIQRHQKEYDDCEDIPLSISKALIGPWKLRTD